MRRAKKSVDPATKDARLVRVAMEVEELGAENAFLRQQLIVLQRQGNRPALSRLDRLLLVLLASRVPNWKQALMLVQPETLLHWHLSWLLCSSGHESRGVDTRTSAAGNPPFGCLSTHHKEGVEYPTTAVLPATLDQTANS